ncbi:hypothetical protein JR316_0003975 [Psilocybe cubensis]|uniref:Uncharacterized protein n=2 Tax=Psilocybe cubensis TaxID=181762 RepID=A0ACB8H990_PSICU|nr:hypothetical protein JR316_0003975 [Psilocybe cubensis]KAH9484493.1 hypothetical protein JR316_0003975 [Psilocybe cubensis]
MRPRHNLEVDLHSARSCTNTTELVHISKDDMMVFGFDDEELFLRGHWSMIKNTLLPTKLHQWHRSERHRLCPLFRNQDRALDIAAIAREFLDSSTSNVMYMASLWRVHSHSGSGLPPPSQLYTSTFCLSKLMPQPRTRSHSTSGTLSRNFLGDPLSVSPHGGNEQASLHSGTQTSLGSTAKSHRKLLSSQHFKPSRNTVAGPSRTPGSPPVKPLVISRPRAIVRKSLQLPPPVPEKDVPRKPPKVKREDPDSDDEGTLVSAGEVPLRHHDAPKKQISEVEMRPDGLPATSKISRKILAVIPGMSDDEDQDEKLHNPCDARTRPKSIHWGLGSSPYQPDFIIEREEEATIEPFTSLSPPSFHGRKKAWTNWLPTNNRTQENVSNIVVQVTQHVSCTL